MHRVSTFTLGAAIAVSALGAADRPARAQWIGPPEDVIRGVTAKGDTYFQYGVTPTVASHEYTLGDPGGAVGTGRKPKIFWPTGGSGYSTVAFEFPWVYPASPCVSFEWVDLIIPLAAPFTPSAPIQLELRTYWDGADGVVDAQTRTVRQTGPFIEDMYDMCVSGPGCADADGDGRNDIIGTLTLPAGVEVTSLEFVVRWDFSRDRLNQGVGPYRGFFLDRGDTTQDGQVITLENGGAVIDYHEYGGCGLEPWPDSAAACFQDFPNGDWVAVEFLGTYYDWDLGGWVSDGAVIPGDPITGGEGCTITQYPEGLVPGVNFLPNTYGAVLAAFDVDLSAFPVPPSPTNPIVVTIGYHAFPEEQDREQKLVLLHAADYTTALPVTHEYASNRKGNLDGGVLQSVELTSASPFILAFEAPVVDCDAMSASDFAPPMGSTRKLGSSLPMKLGLALGDVTLDSLELVEEAGLTAPVVRILDVTGGGATLVTERALRATGAKWSEEVALAPSLFAPNRTYEAWVRIGSCDLVPPNATFWTR